MESHSLTQYHQLPFAMAAACRAEAWPRLQKLALQYQTLLSDETTVDKLALGTHMVHTYFGLAAMAEGNVKQAKEHLMESISSFHSFALRENGPNLLLAKKLLEAGEKEVVLEFLSVVDPQWIGRLKRGDTADWEIEIEKGTVPDFGKNLEYYMPRKPRTPKILFLARMVEYIRETWGDAQKAS